MRESLSRPGLGRRSRWFNSRGMKASIPTAAARPDSVGLDVRQEDELAAAEWAVLKRASLADLAPVEAWSVRGSNQKLAYATHGAFRFFGKFPPPIATHLIEEHSEPGETVVDPMCGSGTTGVEALLAGRAAVLGDVSPLSLLLARVKTRPLSTAALDAALERIHGDYRPLTVERYPFLPVGLRNPQHWFLSETADSLRGLRALIEAEPEGLVREALWVAFAGTVRRVSRATTQQGRLFLDVETALPEALPTFEARAERLRDALETLAGAEGGPVEVEEMDMREPQRPYETPLAILHPPYFNAYRYSSVNSLELAWLGVSHADVRRGEVREFFKVGKGENLLRYVADMRAVLANAAGLTAAGGVVALMIGDTALRGEYVPVVRTLLDQLPETLALDSIAVRVPRFTEATWVASQRRKGGDVGIKLMDYVLTFRKRR
jgi:DNA methylase